MEYPKLYKLNAHGKVLEWYLERDGDKYRTISGQQDGKQTTSKWTVSKPKNSGKKNATTGEEQADKECLAKYEKKLKGGGYVDNLEEVVQFTYVKPMLADTYYSEKWDPETGEVKITDNRPTDEQLAECKYVLQPKLDGSIQGNSKVITREGLKTIREIVENKLFIDVLSYNESKSIFEYKPITGHSGDTSSSYKDWKDIYINDLFYLKCTFDHPIYTNNGWKQAKDLDIKTDKLYVNKLGKYQQSLILGTLEYITPTSNNYEWVNFNIKNSRYCKGKIIKYDIEVKDNYNFVANNIVVHNCRMIASKDGLFTRKGEKIIGVPHIADGLKPFFEENEIILDGELYIHNMDFNEVSGTIRRDPENDTEEEAKVRAKIKYFVYDIISEDPYRDRLEVLALLNSKQAFPEKVYTLITQTPTSREEIANKHDNFVNQGYEGAILRNITAPYQEGKRTRDLLKVKQFEDAEFTITDILEGDGNHSGLATKIEIEDNGVKVYPSMTGKAEFKQQVLKEKEEYIGGQVTVKFFGRTPDGSLRHPSVKAIYKGERDM